MVKGNCNSRLALTFCELTMMSEKQSCQEKSQHESANTWRVGVTGVLEKCCFHLCHYKWDFAKILSKFQGSVTLDLWNEFISDPWNTSHDCLPSQRWFRSSKISWSFYSFDGSALSQSTLWDLLHPVHSCCTYASCFATHLHLSDSDSEHGRVGGPWKEKYHQISTAVVLVKIHGYSGSLD